MNFPQSSRRAGMFNTKTFPEAQVADVSKPSYFAAKFYKNSGDVDVKIIEKEKANPLHYLIGAAVVVAVVMFATKKLDF